MSNYRTKAIQGLFDYTTGEFVGVRSDKSQEGLVLTVSVDPVSGTPIIKSGDATFLTIPAIPDISQWQGNKADVVDSTLRALKQSRNLTPHVSRADAFSSVSTGAGDTQFAGGTLVPSGDVVFCPFTSANVKHYRHSTGVVTTGAAHGQGAGAYMASAYARAKDKVVFAPGYASAIGIWDHNNLTFTAGPVHGEATPAFRGACEIADGRIIFAPHASLYVGIYDPVKNTYTRGPAHGQAANAFHCACPLPNGDVIFSPISGSGNIGIYTPDYIGGGVGTFTVGPAHGEGALAFQGAVLMPNGKVCLVPYNSAYVGIYTPTGPGAGTYTRGPAVASVTTGTTLQFSGGTLLADGRVLMTPRSCTNFIYYDWKTNTLQLGPAHGQPINSNMYVGATLIFDGVVIAAPWSSTNVGIISTYMTPLRDMEFCMHAGWNHY